MIEVNEVAVSFATGHPCIEQLMVEQGTGRIADVSALRDDFWPAA